MVRGLGGIRELKSPLLLGMASRHTHLDLYDEGLR